MVEMGWKWSLKTRGKYITWQFFYILIQRQRYIVIEKFHLIICVLKSLLYFRLRVLKLMRTGASLVQLCSSKYNLNSLFYDFVEEIFKFFLSYQWWFKNRLICLCVGCNNKMKKNRLNHLIEHNFKLSKNLNFKTSWVWYSWNQRKNGSWVRISYDIFLNES